MATLTVKTASGASAGSVEVSDKVFAIEPNKAVLHQVVTAQLAARRSGSQSTKTRAEVRGGGIKPWRQKGTGRARSGSRRSPLWRGGGTVFGPMPRSYAYTMPKKKRRVALCSVLSLKVREDAFRVIERFDIQQPKTREVVQMVKHFTDQRKVLLLVSEPHESLHLSARNIPDVKVLPVAGLNVYDLLHYTTVICAEEAIEKIVGRLT